MNQRAILLAVRRVALWGALFGIAYLAWRADFMTLPSAGCSPLHGFAPGDRVLVDRRPERLAVGDAVLFAGGAGELLLGRVSEPPAGLAHASRAALDAGALWIVTERADCPGADSDELGPIDRGRVVARLIMVVGW